ncbi:MAG: hypothetical protein H6842_03710 [Rhodospirillaceae bacterium]|nr:hypothetical protein [Rhodospirillaceae bacterium]
MDPRDRHRTTTTINTAARFLGVSVETLRKRLQRGSVDGFKAEDGTWRVVLDMSGGDIILAEPERRGEPDVLLKEVRRSAAGQRPGGGAVRPDGPAGRPAWAGGLPPPPSDDQNPIALTEPQIRQILVALLDYLQHHQSR